jgi:hypothetical protein
VTPSPKSRPTWGGVPLARRRVLLGLAADGGFLAVDLGAVAYAGGIATDHPDRNRQTRELRHRGAIASLSSELLEWRDRAPVRCRQSYTAS